MGGFTSKPSQKPHPSSQAGNDLFPPEDSGEGNPRDSVGASLDKSFGYNKSFLSMYEVGEEVGRGHFVYTRVATGKKGEMKGQKVAVKIIPKANVHDSCSLPLFF